MYKGKQKSEKYLTQFLKEVAFGKKICYWNNLKLFSTSCQWAEKISTSDANFGDCPPLDMLVNIQILNEKQFLFFFYQRK